MTRKVHTAVSEVPTHCNEVRLVGRVTGAPVSRELPSGDLVVTLRVTVDRPARGRDAKKAASTRRQVDAVDLACWTARTRGAALRLVEHDVVEVRGALRRRFYRAGAAPVSRYEVEVEQLRRG